MSEVDETIARARAAMERARAREAGPVLQRQTSRGEIERAKRFALLIGAGLAALIGLVIGWSLLIGPVKALGILMLILAAGAVFLGAGILSREAPVALKALKSGSLPAIADSTDRWLSQQRRALPAPAQTLTDQIGQRIAQLRPALEVIDEGTYEAVELKRIVGDELPDLLKRYQQVPANLRRENRNGRVPEQDLVDGLSLIDKEIATIGKSLGAVEMDRLASQKRYLETRYQGEDAGV